MIAQRTKNKENETMAIFMMKFKTNSSVDMRGKNMMINS